LLTMGSF